MTELWLASQATTSCFIHERIQVVKSGMRKGGSANTCSSRVSHILQLLYQTSEFRLLKNVDFFMSFRIKEWSVVSVDLFLALMKPVDLTSKQCTVQVIPVISLTNSFSFSFSFSRFIFSILHVNGHGNSKTANRKKADFDGSNGMAL